MRKVIQKKRKIFIEKLDRFITWALIPFLLIILGVYFSFVYTSQLKNGFTVLQYNHKFENNLKDIKNTYGIFSTFKADENYMGIVSIHFDTSSRGEIIFRLREKGSKDWYYQATLDSYVFARDEYFTFGFPIIKSSKGKEYVFELISKQKPLSNFVQFDNKSDIYQIKYQQPRDVILSPLRNKLTYFIKKVINLFSEISYIFHILVYVIPLISYILILKLLLKKSDKRKNKYLRFSKYFNFYSTIQRLINNRHFVAAKFNFTVIILFLITVSIFYINVYYDIIFIILGVLWLWNIYKNNLWPRLSATIGLIMLLFTSIFIIFDQSQIANKLSAWAYLMLFSSLSQELFSIYIHKK